MNEKVSERLKELYKASGNKMVVTTLRGKQHEILLSKDDKYFYSYTALDNGKIELKLSWFDGIVDFIKEKFSEDRKHLSEDGLMIVVVTISKEDGKVLAGPDIISRGFVYVRESEDLMDGAKNVIKDVLRDCEDRNIKEWAYLKNNIKEKCEEDLISPGV